MSPARATASARPDELHRYRDDVARRNQLVRRALRDVERAWAAYGAACGEVPLSPPPVGAAHDVAGRLHGFAARVGEVGDAFLLADRSPGGDLARVGDARLAHVIVERFPGLANATVLGPLADDLAGRVADELAEAALEDRVDLSELRSAVPSALAADPRFARAVLGQLDTDRFAVLVDQVAVASGRRWDAEPGVPSDDLRWLGDLFARGAARSQHGGPTEATRALLAGRDGRTAVRILRASSSIPLPAAVLEAVALATAVLHPSRTDGGNPFLVDRRWRDTGDDAILREAARVPGLALRLLTGDDPEHPVRGRVERVVGASPGTSQRGLAALVDAARSGPGRHAPDGGLSLAGLELLHGAVSAMAELPGDGLTTDAPSARLVAAVTAVITDDVELAVAHTRAPDDAGERRQRVAALTRCLEHAAEEPGAWSVLVKGLDRRRRAAIGHAVETGDGDALELAGRLDAIMTEAAANADAPDRQLDPVVDHVADAAGAFARFKLGPFGGTAVSAGIDVAADRAADELAGEPGSAGERLRATDGERDRVLAVIRGFPDQVVWAGSGVSGPAELAAAARSDAGDRVLEQWELVQGPELHQQLARLRATYAAGADLSS